MKKQVTYSHLAAIERDIVNLRTHSPALEFMLADKFDRFYRLNGQRLNILHNTMSNIQKKFIEHDEKGLAVTIDGQDGKKEWKFLPNITDSDGLVIIGGNTQEQYYKEANSFLELSFTIEI
ncbi:hypothetical protein QEG73_21795 [Chitinophagaceae bacterium 26-R-25]|nr:hypothetical protein [Chitinophagaceae bacterium 26-R-25]